VTLADLARGAALVTTTPWKEVRSPDGRYKAQMPGTHTKMDSQMTATEVNLYFSVVYVDSPEYRDKVQARDHLDTSRESRIATGNVLLVDVEHEVGGYTARDLVFEYMGYQRAERHILVVERQRMYTLTVIIAMLPGRPKAAPADAQKFFSSFEITR
jgi:hypothetical protein